MDAKKPKNRASSFFGVVFIFLILILIISLGGFFYYFIRPAADRQSKGVDFWLYRHPSQVTGQEETFFIFIKNQETRDIDNVQAVLEFPQGFVLISSQPQCGEIAAHKCFWSFNNIKKGELKEIELKGRVFGQANQSQSFNGDLNFQIQGFSSDFQEKLSSSIMLESPIFVKWNIPERISSFDDLESIVYLENLTFETIPQVEVVIDYPENFFPKQDLLVDKELVDAESQIEIDEREHKIKWTFDNLNPSEKKELKFNGYVAVSDIQEAVFDLQAGLISGNDFFPQIVNKKSVFIDKFDFDVSLQVRGLETPQTCSWGEVLLIDLIYSNNSQEVVGDFVLKLILAQDEYLDFGKLSQSLSWSSKQILPGESGKISFNLPIKSALEAAKSGYSQAEMSIQTLVNGKFISKKREWETKSNQIQIKIKTDLRVEAEARYYDDERLAIGQGPLPPRTSEETRYWIFWRLRNTTNPVENIFIKTQLPEGVNWIGETKASQGSVSYDNDSRQVFWQIPKLSTYQGGSYSLVEAGFEVSIFPEASQIGLFLPLTREIYLTARDQFTETEISQQVNFLTTELIDDPVGEGLGQVVE